MPKRPVLSAGGWCGVAAVVVLTATLAVPWVQRGVAGTAERAEVLLTAAYPTTPVPGLLVDLESLIDLQPVGSTPDTLVTDACVGCQTARVTGLPDRSGLLITPQRVAFLGAAESGVVAVVLNLDGTERWRVAGERFRGQVHQDCLPALETTTCLLTTQQGDLTILRLRTADGTILAERDLPDTTVAGWSALDVAEADLLLLRDNTSLVRYDPDADRDLWSLDVSSWGSRFIDHVWAQADDEHLIVSADFAATVGSPSTVGALVDPDSGELRWRTEDTLATHEGRLYEIPFPEEGITRLDEVGVPLWTVDGALHYGWYEGEPLVIRDDRLERLDDETGDVLWSAAWPGQESWVRIDEEAGTVTVQSDNTAESVVLDPDSGLVLDRFAGGLIADDPDRRYVLLGRWGEDQVVRATDREGTTLWELPVADLVPGDQPHVTVLAGRLAVLSTTHVLLLEPA